MYLKGGGEPPPFLRHFGTKGGVSPPESLCFANRHSGNAADIWLNGANCTNGES